MQHDFILDHQHKSFPAQHGPLAASALADQHWNVLANDLGFPLAVIRQSALTHNLRWMQDYAARRGVSFAPHGKTTMSPQLFAMQLAAGAWGLTLATVYQAAVGVEAGARRILIANQVLAAADLERLAGLLAAHAELRIWFLVDSLAQLALIEAWAAARSAPTPPFDVLLEIGMTGQRTGCRNLKEALTVARALADSRVVRLGGIECYEGGLARADGAQDPAAVTALVRLATQCLRACDAEALFVEQTEIIVSAGGSAVFDLVMPLLRLQGLSLPLRGVQRSGCYITHDHGHYARFLALVQQREALIEGLRAALCIWTLVQSVPEPGLALLTCGRRDIAFDIEMPIPVQYAPRGALASVDSPKGWKVSALNDQHAYLRFDPASAAPQVGDRVGLGISHPCTTFDKWRWMALVDDAWNVTGAIATHF